MTFIASLLSWKLWNAFGVEPNESNAICQTWTWTLKKRTFRAQATANTDILASRIFIYIRDGIHFQSRMYSANAGSQQLANSSTICWWNQQYLRCSRDSARQMRANEIILVEVRRFTRISSAEFTDSTLMLLLPPLPPMYDDNDELINTLGSAFSIYTSHTWLREIWW